MGVLLCHVIVFWLKWPKTNFLETTLIAVIVQLTVWTPKVGSRKTRYLTAQVASVWPSLALKYTVAPTLLAFPFKHSGKAVFPKYVVSTRCHCMSVLWGTVDYRQCLRHMLQQHCFSLTATVTVAEIGSCFYFFFRFIITSVEWCLWHAWVNKRIVFLSKDMKLYFSLTWNYISPPPITVHGCLLYQRGVEESSLPIIPHTL